MSELLRLEKREEIAIISVNRPHSLNALNREIIDALDEVLTQIADDAQIRALVIGGTENFAAGADIAGMVECDPEGAKVYAFSPTYNKLDNLEIPTIAAISGYALGGGLELALCCDLRIATEDAKLGLPEIGLGIMPGAGGTIRLPRLIGYSKAFEMIATGKPISGGEAYRIGLVNCLAEKEALLDDAVNFAMKLAKKPAIAMKTAKRTVKTGLTLPTVAEGVAMEADEWASLFTTQDQKEGMHAFLEKRKPIFVGK